VENSESQPTSASYMVYEDIAPKVNAQLRALNGVLTQDISAFNKTVRDSNTPAVVP
jgi:hypothetical protein